MKRINENEVQKAKEEWQNAKKYYEILSAMNPNSPKTLQAIFEAQNKQNSYRMILLAYKWQTEQELKGEVFE